MMIPPTGSNDALHSNYVSNPLLDQVLDRVLDEYPEEFGHMEDSLRKAAFIRYREILHETVVEYNRCGEFVRIFPSKNSKAYEKFFSGAMGTRMLNRVVHKVLFSNEIMPYTKGGATPLK